MKMNRIIKTVSWVTGITLLLALLFMPLDGTALPVGNGLAWAQTGAPPAPTPVTVIDESHPRGVNTGNLLPNVDPGVSVVQVIRVPALPENMVPLADEIDSTIVRVPSDNRPEVVGVVDFSVSDGSMLVLSVPGTPNSEKLVRIAELPQSMVPAPLPEFADTNTAYVFEFDLFECTQGCVAVGDALHQHNPPLQLLMQPPLNIDPGSLALLHYDQSTGDYQVLLGTLRMDGYLQFPLATTSKFVLTKITDWDAAQDSIVHPVLVPTGLPRTGDGSGQAPFNVLYGVFTLAGLGVIAFGLRMWQGKRSRS